MDQRSLRMSATRSAHSAYLLHRYDWSESSLILDLFTRDEGRVVVAAKGAKRPSSQWRGVLLPFQRLQVVVGRRRAAASQAAEAGEVLPLRSAEWAGGAALPREAALLAGFYLNELLMKLLARHDPHPALFDAYALTLPALGARDDPRLETALRAFELLLLREIGLLPDLALLTQTQSPLKATGRYVLRAESGLHEAGGADMGEPAIPAAVWQRLQQELSAPVSAAAVESLQQICGKARIELKPMLRQLLHYHLGTPQLRSRQVMLELQAQER
ncbi:MAG: repair protein RecO [Pseudomonadota bacterium]|jgi:DNA repair protein RecO (recombination protein O)